MELLSLANALNGVRAILSAYDGYERAKFLETDFAVREEVRRRTEMITDHLNRMHDRVLQRDWNPTADELRVTKETLVSLASDVQFAVSSLPASNHTSFAKLGRPQRRKLVNHDLYSLQMLVNVTNMCNDIFEAMQDGSQEEAKILSLVEGVHDAVGRARNHLRERNMYVEGLVKR